MKYFIGFLTAILAMSSSLEAKTISYTTEETIASTLYFEARSEGEIGIKAVASIIWNRAHQKRWSKLGMKGICLQKMQFSCFNNGFKIPNPKKPADVKAYKICQKIAKEMVDNTFKPSHTGNHYIVKTLKVKKTHWSNFLSNVVIIGAHKFGTC